MTIESRVVASASRVGRDFSEFMKGEKDINQALASVDLFMDQLIIHGCTNHGFVGYMLRSCIMQTFMDAAKEKKKEERRRKIAEAKNSK